MGKRGLVLIVVAFAVFLSVYFIFDNHSRAQLQPKFILGDANGDGFLDISDAVTILQHVHGMNVPIDLSAADFEKDRDVDESDAAAFLEWLFVSGTYNSEKNNFGKGENGKDVRLGPSVFQPPYCVPSILPDGGIRGDSNNDGNVDISDAIYSLLGLFVPDQGFSSVCLTLSDANNDNFFDISDPVATLLYLFVPGTPPLDEPFSSPGYDYECSEETWEMGYDFSGDDIAYALYPTRDCGYVVGGISGGNLFAMKVDSQGSVVWNNTYPYTGVVVSIDQSYPDGFVLLGLSIGGTYSYTRLVRIDADGNEDWNQLYSFGGGPYTTGRTVKQTHLGNFVFAGSSGSVTDLDMFLARTYPNGTIEWVKYYNGTGSTSELFSLSEIIGYFGEESEYIMYGRVGDFISSSPFFVRTYENGTVIDSEITLSSPGPGRSVKQVGRQGVILQGDDVSGVGNGIHILKKNESWDTEWSYLYGTGFSQYGYSVDVTEDGYIIGGLRALSSTAPADGYLLSVNRSGLLNWERVYDVSSLSNDQFRSMVYAYDGGIAMAGFSNGFGSDNDIYIVKTDSLGYV